METKEGSQSPKNKSDLTYRRGLRRALRSIDNTNFEGTNLLGVGEKRVERSPLKTAMAALETEGSTPDELAEKIDQIAGIDEKPSHE